jgi:hypothetical protein
MRQITHLTTFLFDSCAIIHYADGGWRVAIKLFHTRMHRWYLMIPMRHWQLVECIRRDDAEDG